jgi:hypothetical protein
MVFLIFAILGFIVLRLSFRGRVTTFVLLAVALGLAADFALDLLIAGQK